MYTLYGQIGAGSVAPQMVLEELGVPYRFEAMTAEGKKAPAFLKISPMGAIPVLQLPDASTITESAAMIIHLTDAHPSALAPKPGTPDHARYLQWMVFLSANVYETSLRTFYADRYTTGGTDAAAGVKAKAAEDLGKHYRILEKAADPYLLGKAPSAADLYLTMFTTWSATPKAFATDYPRLAVLAKAVLARPAVAKVMKANAE